MWLRKLNGRHSFVGEDSPHISSAPTQGHPSPGRSAPPRFAAESVRADTLRALPENVATPYAYWSKRAVLSTLRWRDNTAPFAVCFSLPLSLQPMQKYLRNILEKHCSGRPHNLRWSYHAIRPEGQPQMRNHYYKYLLCILLLIACVLLVILAVLSNNNPGNEKDGTASTHAPSNTSTYWDKDRMESASPAPMPE